MKKIMSAVFVLLILAAVFFFAKNAVAKVLIENGIEAVTGLPLKMQGIDLNFSGSFVKVDDLKIYNPAGYPSELMAHVPEIYVQYDLAALLKGKVYLPELRFALEEFHVVRNKQGELNLDRLKAVAEQPAGAPEETQPAQSSKPAEIQIDRFVLKVGRVQFKDYSSRSPSVRKFEINLNETFTNITDPNVLVRLIVSKALMSTSIAMLTGFDVAGLHASVSGLVGVSLGTAQNLADGSVGMIQDAAGQLGSVVKPGAVLGKAEDTARGAASMLRSGASSLTGGLSDKLKSI